MPIGLVSDLEFEKELNSGKNKESHSPRQVEIVEKPTKGRTEGSTNVPDSLRQIIGEEHLLNGREAALDLAKDFGISSSQVSAYANGATSTASYSTPKPSIINHINKSRERATKRASRTLNAALAAITQEKLDYADASDLSGIAKDMSVIIKNLEPKHEVSEASAKVSNPQFIIYAPQFKREDSFETIVVNE